MIQPKFVLAGDTFVKSWLDQAAGDGADNADQSNDADQPKYIASAVNGEPALEFSNSGNNHLDIVDRADLNPGTGGYSVFMVLKTNNLTGNNFFLHKGNHGLNQSSLLLWQNAPRGDRENDADEAFPGTGRPALFNTQLGDQEAGGDGRVIERIAADNNWNILSAVLDGSTINGYLNGDDSGVVGFNPNGDYSSAGPPIDTSMTPLRIGNSHILGGTDPLDGMIAEVAIYDAALSLSARLAIEQELGTKYGISVVPEPTTWLLLIMGTAGMATVVWRRRRRE